MPIVVIPVVCRAPGGVRDVAEGYMQNSLVPESW